MSVDDKALFIGRWLKNGDSMQTGYPGSSMRFVVTGTNKVVVSCKGATRVAYKVDDFQYKLSPSNESVTITGLSRAKSHTIKMIFTSSIQSWEGNNLLTVSDITVEDGGRVLPAYKYKRSIVVYGDSITEGYNTTYGGYSASDKTWWNILADKLEVDITPVGIGGIGYTKAANTYPAVSADPSYINYIDKGYAAPVTNADIVILELGTNDGKSAADIDTDYVTAVKSTADRIKAMHPHAGIYAMIPFNSTGKASLISAYESKSVTIIPQSFYGNIAFADALHPAESGSYVIADALKQYFTSKYPAGYFDTLKRIDCIYVDESGNEMISKGTASSNPSKPDLPEDGIPLFEVTTAENNSRMVVDDCKKYTYPHITYRTVADMKQDRKLFPEMVATTLGYYNEADGCGETYHIIKTDCVIDEDRYIRLDNGLVAERITQSDLPDIFMAGFFESDANTDVKLYTSHDGAHMADLIDIGINCRDFSIKYYKQCFYTVDAMNTAYSFRIRKSRNLIDWEEQFYTVCDRTGKSLWAPDLYIDDDGSAYVYFALQWGTEKVGVATKELPAFNIWVSKCGNIEDGKWADAVKIDLPEFDDDAVKVPNNNIDATVTKINGNYYMLVKNEHAQSLQKSGGYSGCNLHLLKSNNPMAGFSEVKTFLLQYVKGVEGPILFCRGNTVYIYADNYQGVCLPRTNKSAGGGYYLWVSTVDEFEKGTYHIEPVRAGRDTRHGCVIDIHDNYPKRIIQKLGYKGQFLGTIKSDEYHKVNLSHYNGFGQNDNQKYIIDNFVPFDGLVYTIQNRFSEIKNIRNVYNANKFYIQFLIHDFSRLSIKYPERMKGRSVWIGNSRGINESLLPIILDEEDIPRLLKNPYEVSEYKIAGNAVNLFCTFDLRDDMDLAMRFSVKYATPVPFDAYKEINYRVFLSRKGTNVVVKIKHLDDVPDTMVVKLIKTGDYQYQIWVKADRQCFCSVKDIQRDTDVSPDIFSFISFEPSTLNDFPSGTVIEMK